MVIRSSALAAVICGVGLTAGASFAQAAQPNAGEQEAALIGRIVLAPGLKDSLAGAKKLISPALADPADAALSLNINRDLLAKREHKKAGEDASAVWQLQLAADADAVFRRGEGDWELLRAEDAGNVALLGRASGELALAPAMRAILGYDGVVVGQDGPVVLAQTPDLSGRKDLYAVALTSSETRLVIKAGEAFKHSALLRLLSSREVPGHGTMARFRIVSSKTVGPLAVGTKLRIEALP